MSIIKQMQLTDWLRLYLALGLTGILLFYNPELTQKVANQLAITNPISFQYKLIRWIITVISIAFLGIALPRNRFIETMTIVGGLLSFQIIREFVSFYFANK